MTLISHTGPDQTILAEHKAFYAPRSYYNSAFNLNGQIRNAQGIYKFYGLIGLNAKQFKLLASNGRIKYTGELLSVFDAFKKFYSTKYSFVLPVYRLGQLTVMYGSTAVTVYPGPAASIKVEYLKYPFIYNKNFTLAFRESSPITAQNITGIPTLIIFLDQNTHEYKLINDITNLGLL